MKKWDVVATIRFTDRSGEEKKRYVRCGIAQEGDKGISLKIDSVPVGDGWNGWLSLYEPKEKTEAPQGMNAKPDDDSTIPF